MSNVDVIYKPEIIGSNDLVVGQFAIVVDQQVIDILQDPTPVIVKSAFGIIYLRNADKCWPSEFQMDVRPLNVNAEITIAV